MNINLQLIADKSSLFFLELFNINDKSFNKIKSLLKRKIDGDAPTQEEWTVASISTIAASRAIANANANAIARAIANSIATVDYIIDLLGDEIIKIDDLDVKVLSQIEEKGNALDMDSWHTCKTTHCRAGWEVIIHPQGLELEKYFGTWMAASVIHKAATGRNVNYYATNRQTMNDLRRA
jgi:hypothetical protein